jgi:hypothetical protein
MISKLTLTLYRIAQATGPLTSREVAQAIALDYERNFNKREMRYAKKLAGFITRERIPVAGRGRRRLWHWSLADAWRGQRPLDIVRAFRTSASHVATAPEMDEIAQ